MKFNVSYGLGLMRDHIPYLSADWLLRDHVLSADGLGTMRDHLVVSWLAAVPPIGVQEQTFIIQQFHQWKAMSPTAYGLRTNKRPRICKLIGCSTNGSTGLTIADGSWPKSREKSSTKILSHEMESNWVVIYTYTLHQGINNKFLFKKIH